MDDYFERLGRLPTSMKAAICIGMTETCVQTCAFGIRQQNRPSAMKNWKQITNQKS